MTDQPKPRGFAAMDPERVREISRLGGASVPAERRAYSVNRALAAAAGARGGTASRGGKGAVKP